MAFGRHWEWRAFGAAPAGVLERLSALPLKFPTAQVLTDEYLWTPSVGVNVKLRLGDLKFKRLLEVRRGFELWLEDPAENHAMPVGCEVVEKLASALVTTLPRIPSGVFDRDGLLAFLRSARPPVRVVSVSKARWQRAWRPPGSSSDAEGVTVEIAEIHSPVSLTSLSLEAPVLELLERAVDELAPGEGLRRASYLEALREWGALEGASPSTSPRMGE